MTSPSRIYTVQTAAGDAHLVRAHNLAHAIRYVAARHFTAHVATQQELVDLAKDHIVQDATKRAGNE